MVSKSQIDRLGERLKAGELSADDLRELDAYRQSFAGAYEVVFSAIRQELGLTPTGRPAKSSTAIVDKLRRETIRLSQIQDIAGCRIVVEDIRSQQEVTGRLSWQFHTHDLVDRRVLPSHGYRAVHLVVWHENLPVEVQIRTTLQHLWAELSERLSDKLGIELKYGGGHPEYLRLLDGLSATIREFEALDDRLVMHEGLLELANMRREVEAYRVQLVELLSRSDQLLPPGE